MYLAVTGSRDVDDRSLVLHTSILEPGLNEVMRQHSYNQAFEKLPVPENNPSNLILDHDIKRLFAACDEIKDIKVLDLQIQYEV